MSSYKKRNLDEDYSFGSTEISGEEFSSIKILKGPYSGVEYLYGAVDINQLDEESGKLSFQYSLITVPDNHTKDSLKIDPEFTREMGEILNSILIDDMESNDNEYREDNSPSTN
jgi:hypothetical protein